MRRRIRRLTCLALASALSLAAGIGPSPCPASEEGEPLTNESVVRMVMRGTPEEEILRMIGAAPVRFDTDPEILDELRSAGVPEVVVLAMVERQKALSPEPGPSAGIPEPPGPGWIRIVFEDEPEKPAPYNSVLYPSSVLLEGGGEDPVPVSLAFLVICTDHQHVPAGWSHITPAPTAFRRHKVLFFEEATAPSEERGEKGLVYLAHPHSWPFRIEPGIHRGLIAVIARAGEEEGWRPVLAEEYENLEVSEGMVTRVHVRLRSTRAGRRRGRQDESRGAAAQDQGIIPGHPWLRPSLEIAAVDPPEPAPPEGVPREEGPGGEEEEKGKD